MKGECVSHNGFVIYPEYCGYNAQSLIRASRGDERVRVASVLYKHENVAIALRNGFLLYRRAKYHLHESEIDEGVRRGVEKPEVVMLGGRNVLILICYEMLFPAEYLPQRRDVALIVHLVGAPMYSEAQREGWVALQRMLSLLYSCPVICCCGGPKGRMNISGVTRFEGGPK